MLFYSQWVWFDSTNAGSYRLPTPDNYASITFVADRGPVYQGIVRIARSPDGHQAEMVAPFRGFMRDPSGNPIVALGKTIDVSFSLEASPELAPPPSNSWASDTADPIVGYSLSPYREPELQIAPSVQNASVLVSWPDSAKGMRLQRTSRLSNPDWQFIPGSESANQITLPIEGDNAFFRLVEP